MTIIELNPGACGLKTIIEAKLVAPGHVYVSITSDCADVSELKIGIVDAMTELFGGFNDPKVYSKADEHIKHGACPVPCAILKAVEAEADLAVPRDVVFEIRKEEED